jgi:hypothetical protein
LEGDIFWWIEILNLNMDAKPMLLMETTKEQLEAIEVIDSEMAATIVDARTSKIIDLNFVYSITGIHFPIALNWSTDSSG